MFRNNINLIMSPSLLDRSAVGLVHGFCRDLLNQTYMACTIYCPRKNGLIYSEQCIFIYFVVLFKYETL